MRMKKGGIVIGLGVHIQVTAIKQNKARVLIGVVKLMVKTRPELTDKQQRKRVQVPELRVGLVSPHSTLPLLTTYVIYVFVIHSVSIYQLVLNHSTNQVSICDL